MTRSFSLLNHHQHRIRCGNLLIKGLYVGLDSQCKRNSNKDLAVNAGISVRALVTEGTAADCTEGCVLIDGTCAGWLTGGKGYDSNAIIAKALEQKTRTVIPSKNRHIQRGSTTFIFIVYATRPKTLFCISNAGMGLLLVMRSTLLLRCRCPNQMHCPVRQCPGVNSCPHHLITHGYYNRILASSVDKNRYKY